MLSMRPWNSPASCAAPRTLARFITRFFGCGGLPNDALPASELLERKAEQ